MPNSKGNEIHNKDNNSDGQLSMKKIYGFHKPNVLLNEVTTMS